MRIAVLGAGAGAGARIVRDLADAPGVDGLTLLDRDGAAARAVAERHGATGAAVDAMDRQALTLAVEEHGLVLNAVGHEVALAAMDAALAAGANYLDRGAPDDVSAQQQRLHDAFAAGGLVAVLGGDPKGNGAQEAAAARLLARGALGAVCGVLPLATAVTPALLSREIGGLPPQSDPSTEVSTP